LGQPNGTIFSGQAVKVDLLDNLRLERQTLPKHQATTQTHCVKSQKT